MSTPRLSDIRDEYEDATAFYDVVGRQEHERLDFKRSVGDLYEPFAAMAMTDGGLLVLGVDDRSRGVVGCVCDQQTYDSIHRQATLVGIDVQIRRVRVGSAEVTVIAVPEVRERIVTTPNGRLLRRVGSDNVPLVGDAMARFVLDRSRRAADERPLDRPDEVEFDLGLVNRALAADGRPKVPRSGLLRALVDLGCAEPRGAGGGPVPLTGAALLFARDPGKAVKGATVQMVRRVGAGSAPGPVTERREAVGPIPHLVDEVVGFITRHSAFTEAVVGRRRERIPAYPETALREAVLNALAHRDYGLEGATVDVTVWDDRVEVRSPGGLPGHITLENIRDEHYSRNRVVMRSLKLIGLVEEYGEGVDRMFREMEARLLAPPHIVATPTSVTVVLRSQSKLSIEDQVWLQLLGGLDLRPAERLALVHVRNRGEITRRDAAAISEDGDGRTLIRALVAKGLLRQIGERGGSRYVFTDQVVLRAGAGGLEARARRRDMLLTELRRRGSLSVTEGAALLDGNVRTARDLLRDFVAGGLAEARGNTSGRRYFAK